MVDTQLVLYAKKKRARGQEAVLAYTAGVRGAFACSVGESRSKAEAWNVQ